MADLKNRIRDIMDTEPQEVAPLHGGTFGKLYRVTLPDQRRLVVKASVNGGQTLDIEGEMLRYLRQHSDLPVPEVHYSAPDLLIMTFIEGDNTRSAAAQQDAARHLAALHAVTAEHYGFHRDTLIGPLHQPNPWTDAWIPFFREQRLLYMADVAAQASQLPRQYRARIEKLAAQLDELLEEPPAPSLIHGDLWSANILTHDGRIAGFIDPAIYYAHPEIELAYTTLFGTFGDPFFQLYHELRPIQPGFFETRRDIYNLYPLLVHVRLFGGGYVRSVDQILSRFGC